MEHCINMNSISTPNSLQRNQAVSMLRAMALLCILYHHSIIMYHGWPPFNWECSQLKSFPFEGVVSSSFRQFGLCTFTFLSGFVLFYQTTKKKTYFHFLFNKIVRLMIPCAFYAIMYKLIFPTMMFDSSPVNGTHLWYIPMIFACILVVSVQVYRPHLWWISVGLYLISVKMQIFISHRTLWEFVNYFPVFYLGYLLNAFINKGISFWQSITNPKTNLFEIFAFCCMVLLIPAFSKVVHRVYINGEAISVSLLICFMYIILSKLLMRSSNYHTTFVYRIIDKIDKNSFAIYLLHQFVINTCLLTLHSFLASINILLGSTIVFIICLSVSWILSESYEFIKSKIVITFNTNNTK